MTARENIRRGEILQCDRLHIQQIHKPLESAWCENTKKQKAEKDETEMKMNEEVKVL